VQLPVGWAGAHARIREQALAYEGQCMHAQHGCSGGVVSSGEVWRAKAMAFLRGRFDKMCGEILRGSGNGAASSSSSRNTNATTNNSNPSLSPSQAFERWVFNCKTSVVTMDLPVPTPSANRVLMRELQSCGVRKRAAIDTVP
jgi:hypothetical protein